MKRWMVLAALVTLAGFVRAEPEKRRLGDLPADEASNAKPRPKPTPLSETRTPEERKVLVDQACADLLRQATAAQKAGKLVEAKGYLERILGMDSRNVEAQRRLRGINGALKQQKEERAASPKENLKTRLEKEMDRRYDEARWSDARNAAEKLLALDPGHAKARKKLEKIEDHLYDDAVALGRKREAAGDLRGALEAYKAAFGIREDPSLLASIDSLQAKSDDIRRSKSDALYLDALKAAQAGKKEQAKKLCREALKLDPANIYAERMLNRLNAKVR